MASPFDLLLSAVEQVAIGSDCKTSGGSSAVAARRRSLEQQRLKRKQLNKCSPKSRDRKNRKRSMATSEGGLANLAEVSCAANEAPRSTKLVIKIKKPLAESANAPVAASARKYTELRPKPPVNSASAAAAVKSVPVKTSPPPPRASKPAKIAMKQTGQPQILAPSFSAPPFLVANGSSPAVQLAQFKAAAAAAAAAARAKTSSSASMSSTSAAPAPIPVLPPPAVTVPPLFPFSFLGPANSSSTSFNPFMMGFPMFPPMMPAVNKKT